MIKLSLSNQDVVARSVADFARITGRTLADEIVALARLAAVQLARRTQPFGDGKAAKDTGEKRVAEDISRVFLTPASAFSFLDEKDPNIASAFWRAYRNPDSWATDISGPFISYGITVSDVPDPQIHRAARTKNGGVHKNYRARQLVLQEEKLAGYIAQKKKMVGFAKSGWAKAADDCGGHRGILAWASSRHKGSHGSALIDRNPFAPKVLLENHVTYVSDILPDNEAQKAVADAYENSLKKILMAVKKSIRSHPYGRKAA